MKKIFAFIVLVMLAVAGCSQDDAVDPGNDVPDKEDVFEGGLYEFDYQDGILKYNITIPKPTPCHILAVDEVIMESYPVQIRLDVTIHPPPKDTNCVQVIAYESIVHDMDIGHEPGSISVYVDGKKAYGR